MNRYRYYVGYFISRLQLLTSISEKRFHISFRPFQQHLYISDFVYLFASTPIAATSYAVPKRTLSYVSKLLCTKMCTFYMDIGLWAIKISIILYH